MQDTTIEITDKEFCSLGLDLEMIRCKIVLHAGRSLSISTVRFIDCTFEIKKPLKNFQSWCWAFLQNCTFKGKLIGNDFGHWPECYWEHGGLDGGDFRDAILDGVRFLDCDMSKVQLPAWPHFTIRKPKAHQRELLNANPPGKLGPILFQFEWNPDITVAITYYASRIAKACSVTEEELARS